MEYLSSSEDEFPPVETLIQRQRQKLQATEDLDGDKENALTRPGSPRTTQISFCDSIGVGKTPATARRRRRLGQGQPVANSLRKPWVDLNPALETGSKLSSRNTSMMTASTFASDILDRLPAKAKHTDSRLAPGATMFDSPPQERKKTRRLISRGEKKAQELKVVGSERNSLVSDDDVSETSRIAREKKQKKKKLFPIRTRDEDPDFILGKFDETAISLSDSDDDVFGTATERSQSPSAPRRLQRRVLSSSGPTKNFTRSKIVPDDLEKSPKKRSVKQPMQVKPTKVADDASLEEALKKLKIFDESCGSDNPALNNDEAPVLKPLTPRKTLPKSPAKAPIIPLSPWKPEHKEFWDPEVNFAWIDKHSPPKKSTKKVELTGADAKEEMQRKYGTSPEKKRAKKSFNAVKEDLARTFLDELDEVIMQGKLGQLTESTGGLRIKWSNTLQTTAGRAHWKCKTTTTTLANRPPGSGSGFATTTETKQHYASIELGTKVLTNEAALLNTVAHEFCHLAVYLLHGKPKLAHGPEFKSYGQRVEDAAAIKKNNKSKKNAVLKTPEECGVDIEVTTRHSYEIDFRYVWRCAGCAAEVKRHSRSINPDKQTCGRCRGGRFVQVKPTPRGGGAAVNAALKAGGSRDDPLVVDGDVTTATAVTEQKKEKKKLSAYQEFTSREMKALSVSHKSLSFKEKMALVSSRWAEHQRGLKEAAAATATTATSTTTTATTPAKVDGDAAGKGADVTCLVEAVEILDIRD
ncbi:hypothetical protein F5Y17DRAFT_454928 [Xylariaceae sp. FL0594]|nr:hypothetical protein F5Y17DRAFT_454928 [Xylariaceae sp. FL0594]